MTSTFSLREYCHINTNADDDCFVGIKVDTTHPVICFPLGYHLPLSDSELQVDIRNLLNILAFFLKQDGYLESSYNNSKSHVTFPVHAYLTIITDYIQNYLYIEKEPRYQTGTSGQISWSRTIKTQTPILQRNGVPVYTNFSIRTSAPNSDKEITQIHQFCVYESFKKLGWIYTPMIPSPPAHHPSITESISILAKYISNTNNDKKRNLFCAMKSILVYVDCHTADTSCSFGTNHFETVWEKMIDRAFGIPDKEQFFPRTRWLLKYGANKEKRPLYPDSIMIYHDKYYVLDAKYYRYGTTANPDHLPNGTDINKQITYGEYLEKGNSISASNIFNCFIMPYNMASNLFNLTAPVGNIGEAIGDWRYDSSNPQLKHYERIQGIVMDTRYLMFNYSTPSEQAKHQLANVIEEVLSNADVPSPL